MCKLDARYVETIYRRYPVVTLRAGLRFSSFSLSLTGRFALEWSPQTARNRNSTRRRPYRPQTPSSRSSSSAGEYGAPARAVGEQSPHASPPEQPRHTQLADVRRSNVTERILARTVQFTAMVIGTINHECPPPRLTRRQNAHTTSHQIAAGTLHRNTSRLWRTSCSAPRCSCASLCQTSICRILTLIPP